MKKYNTAKLTGPYKCTKKHYIPSNDSGTLLYARLVFLYNCVHAPTQLERHDTPASTGHVTYDGDHVTGEGRSRRFEEMVQEAKMLSTHFH